MNFPVTTATIYDIQYAKTHKHFIYFVPFNLYFNIFFCNIYYAFYKRTDYGYTHTVYSFNLTQFTYPTYTHKRGHNI